ncbi:hypothetical protein Dthio_PD3698 [Desulfonatronospira thiodismutans ASO3-1]|uniref:Prepilin-type N-terminal cleavage/methylation domain-containing protein n=1 Tax=Desulfonatronospira thiodismutans ASO3-1 TaxID=555779 RepID=D6SK38_9BACT|nr:prepilin-type N-terminal cleavage/methylation domain-containing protein [Desulfonatronospira thiodismutans]EFI36241.1 hypothetical protein Dthio_PD3698 [Desulfonatronospira thiodismutans ASO3-1]
MPSYNYFPESKSSCQGLTLIELLVILAILGIIISIMGMNLRPFGNDLENATQETAGFFKQTRVKAISSTSAYRVIFNTDNHLIVEHAIFCKDEEGWQRDAKLDLELREGVVFNSKDFTNEEVLLCFNSRGFSTENIELEIVDAKNNSKALEVYLGGAVVIK